MQLVDLTGTLVDSLRGTLPNPHSSGNWIYSDFPRCFTEDLEAITKDGWKRISIISIGEEILSFIPNTFLLEWTPVTHKTIVDYKGEAIFLRSPQIRIGLTPNHKIIYSWGTRRKKKWATAQELRRGMYLPLKGRWVGIDKALYEIPSCSYRSRNRYGSVKVSRDPLTISTKILMGILGLYLSEGNLNKHNYVVISQTKEEGRKEIIDFLNSSGLRFYICKEAIVITDPRIGSFLRPFAADCYHKAIPMEYKNLSPKYLRILLHWLLLGDGSKVDKSTNGFEYYTTSRELANDVQEILLKLGYVSRIREKKPERGETCYCIKNFSRMQNLKVTNHVFSQSYEGKVFCLTTSLGTLIVRDRTGHLFFSGNSDATFPRISVTQIAGSLAEIGIGEWTEGKKGKLCTIDYDVDVWVKVEDRAEIPIGSGTWYVGTKLRDKYSDLIVVSLENIKATLKVSGILDVEFVNISSNPLDEEHMLHRKTITVRLTFVWEI